jgi:hypothetical protein
MSQQINKQVYDEEYRICDFSSLLDTLDIVTSQAVTIVDGSGTDCSATMISEVALYVGSKSVRYKLKGGTSGKFYMLSVKVTTASNQKFNEPFQVRII